MVANRIRILVVDDNENVLDALSEMLDQHSDRIQVVGRATGAAGALEVLRREAVDLVLMDIRMPGLDGVEATRIIHVEQPDVPVVLMSAYDVGERDREGAAAGAAAVVGKGDSPAALLDTVFAVAGSA